MSLYDPVRAPRLYPDPGNWFAPPDGNRSRLLPVTKSTVLSVIFLRPAGRHQFLCRGGERKTPCLSDCSCFLHVAVAMRIKHVRMSILLKYIQHRIESSRQLEIAFRSRERDHPHKLNGFTAQIQF